MRNEVLYDRGYLVNYPEGDKSMHRTPINYVPSVNDEYYPIADDDTLLTIAQDKYDNPALWYILADVNINIIPDSFQLEVGLVIVIPNLDILDITYG